MVLDDGDGEGFERRVGSGRGRGLHHSPSDPTWMNKSRDTHGDQATGRSARLSVTDTSRVNDELNAISPARRRRMAVALAPLGLVLLVAGGLALSLAGIGWKLAGLLIAALAVGLLAAAWGLWRSAALSEAAQAEQRLDEMLVAAAAANGSSCGVNGLSCSTTGTTAAVGATVTGVAGGSAVAAGDAACGSAGLLCGLGSAEGGCGASCLTRTR